MRISDTMKRLSSAMPLSISARLTLWYGLSMVILLGVFAAYLYASFHVGLHRDFAATLQEEKARALAALRDEETLWSQGEETLWSQSAADSAAALLPGRFPVGPDTYVRVLSPEGRPLARTANVGAAEAFPATPPERAEEHVIARTFEGARAQTLYAPVYETPRLQGGAGGALRGWMEVTRLESALHRELHRLAWLLGIGALLGVAVALGAGYGLSRRALRPVAGLTQAARRIHRHGFGSAADEQAEAGGQPGAGGQLGANGAAAARRLPVPGGARDELTELAQAFNDMIAALERSLTETRRSFEREKQFRADAAHELMTPVSAIQSEAEITLRRERKPAAYRESLEAIQERAMHMSTLVERLLTLSRLEAGGSADSAARPSVDPSVNLSALTREVARRYRRQAEAYGLTLEIDIEESVWVAASEEDLTDVLGNLLSNALKYTPAGGTVWCALRQDAGSAAVLRVEDTGAGFEGSGEVLFERFRRGGAAQAQGRPGVGLGLAIVRAVAEAYGGKVRAESRGLGRGSAFEVVLPLAATPKKFLAERTPDGT